MTFRIPDARAERRAAVREASTRHPRVAIILAAGVVACLGIALGTAVAKLPDALGLFDLRADLNSTATYSERVHTHREWSPAGGSVLETARLWIPKDATYRVVFGPEFGRTESADFTHQLVYTVLLPRRPTTSARAPWVLCWGCGSGTLGERFRLIAGVPGGPMFGRMTS